MLYGAVICVDEVIVVIILKVMVFVNLIMKVIIVAVVMPFVVKLKRIVRIPLADRGGETRLAVGVVVIVMNENW